MNRSRERYRRAFWTATAMVGARGIASVTALVTVPLALSYLGAERYGMWMTLSSFIALVTFADLGLGNGLLTAVAQKQGAGNRAAIVNDAASAAWTLSAVAAAILAVFAVAYGAVDWAILFNVETQRAAEEAGPSVAVFVVFIALTLPLGLGYHLRNGFQEGYVGSVYVAIGNILGFGGVVAAIVLRMPLPMLVLAMMGGPFLGSAANVIHLIVKRPWLMPYRDRFDHRAARRMLKSGSQYLALQFATGLAFATDSLIAAQIVGASAVADYAVVSKLFLAPTVISTAALFSLWPAYSEASARGDRRWIAQTFRRSLWISVALTAPLCVALFWGANTILNAWVGSAVAPPTWLIAGMAVWTVLNGLGTAVGMLLNALHELRAQIISWFAMAVANVILSIALTSQFGVAGVIWGSVLAFPICTLIPMTLYAARVLNRTEDTPGRPSVG